MEENFALRIERWYEANGRDLPWRQTTDAYRIWVSEIILQQTRVEQGRDYYRRFMETFPTVEDLAEASEDEVLRLWQGLGYYSRARNMHQAAKQVVERQSFPRDYREILQLKGVGEYTAAAIASFAYNSPYAVLDGNVFRVLSRYLGIDVPIDSAQGKKLFREAADEMLDRARPALYNQAIMDFGALHCTPHQPLCQDCPLQDSCQAKLEGRVEKLPVKSHKTAVRDRFFTYIYLRDRQGRILLHRRGEGDIWQGLYQFPLWETDGELEEINELLCQLPQGVVNEVAKDVKHLLSHQRLHAQFFLLEVDELPVLPGYIPVPESDLQQYALPRLLDKIVQKILR